MKLTTTALCTVIANKVVWNKQVYKTIIIAIEEILPLIAFLQKMLEMAPNKNMKIDAPIILKSSISCRNAVKILQSKV